MSRLTKFHAQAPFWLLAPIAIGCAGPAEEAVPLSDDTFWIEVIADPAGARCKGTIEHNFEEAVAVGEDVSAELTEFERRNESASGSYGYLTRQGASGVLLNFAGNVYTGDYVDDSTIEVAWRGSVELEESTEFFEGYAFTSIGAEQIEEVVSLTSTGEPGAPFEGSLVVRKFEDLAFSETDEWDAATTGIFFSSIPAGDYLVPVGGFGVVNNQSFTPQCTSEPCELDVLLDCEETLTIRAWPVEGGIEAFVALDRYRRDGGVPTEPTTP